MCSMPTRIIERPVLMRKKTMGGRQSLSIKCDDGKTYSCPELAAMTGITASGLYNRLADHGWKYKNILCPKNATRGKRLKEKKFIPKGSDEWSCLCNRERSHNLKNIREAGAWERANI